jgi:5-methylcytosine-specific restriction endonuclease McrA
MKKGTQRVMHCPCGRTKILAQGLCSTCYTLKRQDEEYFGGLREAVLKRDDHRCRVCSRPGGRKRSLAVHHRVAGKSELDLMITLCLAHHAMVTRTLVLLEEWPELLRVLWREQHPSAHEQTTINFRVLEAPALQTKLLDSNWISARAIQNCKSQSP